MSETALALADEPAAIRTSTNLFGAGSPAEVVRQASEAAKALADVLRAQNLVANIQGKQHVLVEGWTLLGSMLGVFPVVTWTRELEGGAGWEARVEARTINGDLVGAAEASCTRDEKGYRGKPGRWADADAYAIRAMAQTRATSRALRGPLGFIVSMAGYNPTAPEEISEHDEPTTAPATTPSGSWARDPAPTAAPTAPIEAREVDPTDTETRREQAWAAIDEHYTSDSKALLAVNRHYGRQANRKDYTAADLEAYEAARPAG